uniref:Uncharacterized protein n=1 Tax=uncultured marine virus TaxID=186617 RepID=A0A0F7L903_9VIRU|nr:hypothetical protein [uncultured marine virus]
MTSYTPDAHNPLFRVIEHSKATKEQKEFLIKQGVLKADEAIEVLKLTYNDQEYEIKTKEDIQILAELADIKVNKSFGLVKAYDFLKNELNNLK